jgi:AAA domain
VARVYSLRRFNGRTGNLGKPLPDPFSAFDLHRIKLRHGMVSMVAGAPGSFKSVLALNIVVGWASAGKRVLYFSMDSDEATVAKRVSGILSGESVETVEYKMARGGQAHYAEQLAKLDSVQWIYDQADIDAIALHMRAFEAVHGAWPDAVFVDNLIDTVDDPTNYGGMIQVLRDLDALAREMQSHVCVLHHSSEAWAKDHPGLPPPSWAVQGKVNQIPRLVLTVGANGLALSLAPVKNTNGPSDPTAKVNLPFLVQPSMRVEDLYRLELGV